MHVCYACSCITRRKLCLCVNDHCAMLVSGELDPAAVGQLPPSLQLEVLTKHREQQAQLNRARFQEASKNAAGFSALQMTSYIKQTELRRKMEAVRASSNKARSSAAKGHFVLEDHEQGAMLHQQEASSCSWHSTLAHALSAGEPYQRTRIVHRSCDACVLLPGLSGNMYGVGLR